MGVGFYQVDRMHSRRQRRENESDIHLAALRHGFGHSQSINGEMLRLADTEALIAGTQNSSRRNDCQIARSTVKDSVNTSQLVIERYLTYF